MKRKLTFVERLIIISIGALIILCYFIPWSEYTDSGILIGADNSFAVFASILDEYMNWETFQLRNIQIGVIMFCSILMIPLFIILLIVGLGGWRRVLRVITLLSGGCACLITFFSIGIGPGKLFGFYLMMLCGIALIFIFQVMDRVKKNND